MAGGIGGGAGLLLVSAAVLSVPAAPDDAFPCPAALIDAPAPPAPEAFIAKAPGAGSSMPPGAEGAAAVGEFEELAEV